MPLQERNEKRYRLALLEFCSTFKLDAKTIKNISYWSNCVRDENKDDKTQYIDVDIELE